MYAKHEINKAMNWKCVQVLDWTIICVLNMATFQMHYKVYRSLLKSTFCINVVFFWTNILKVYKLVVKFTNVEKVHSYVAKLTNVCKTWD